MSPRSSVGPWLGIHQRMSHCRHLSGRNSFGQRGERRRKGGIPAFFKLHQIVRAKAMSCVAGPSSKDGKRFRFDPSFPVWPWTSELSKLMVLLRALGPCGDMRPMRPHWRQQAGLFLTFPITGSLLIDFQSDHCYWGNYYYYFGFYFYLKLAFEVVTKKDNHSLFFEESVSDLHTVYNI